MSIGDALDKLIQGGVRVVQNIAKHEAHAAVSPPGQLFERLPATH